MPSMGPAARSLGGGAGGGVDINRWASTHRIVGRVCTGDRGCHRWDPLLNRWVGSGDRGPRPGRHRWGDLSASDIKRVAIDLAGQPASSTGDGQIDSVNINGTGGPDHISVTMNGPTIVVDGLSAQVTLAHAEASDQLVINGFGGDDVIDASGLQANA